MKGLGGTSPTQRAYRSHTSDLIARLDLLLAPKKSNTSADANGKNLAQALGAKPKSGPKSRARNVVLRDLVDVLTKIWRDDKSLDLLEGKRDEVIPSPPSVESHVLETSLKVQSDDVLETSIKVESHESPQKSVPFVAHCTEDVQCIKNTLVSEALCFQNEQVVSELNIGSFNHGEPFTNCWVPASESTDAEFPTALAPSVLSSYLEEQPGGIKQEESCCTTPCSDEDFDSDGFVMDDVETPESPFEEKADSPFASPKCVDFGFSWNAFAQEEAPLMAW